MELIERYLQAVKFWLPKEQRQDIIAELREDIHAQMEAQETELGRKFTESEVESLLKQRGRPLLVATRYLPQEYLIGPALFPIYLFVLKVVALCYLVPWVLVWIGMMIYSPTYRADPNWGSLWGSAWTAVFVSMGVVTIVFAVLERTQAKSHFLEEWDPRKLPPVRDPNRIRLFDSIVELVVNLFVFGWWAQNMTSPIVLNHPALRITLAPVWSYFFWGFLVISLVNASLALVNLMRPYSTKMRAAIRLVSDAAGSGLFCWLLKANVLTEFAPANVSAARVIELTNAINWWMAKMLPAAIVMCVVILVMNAYKVWRSSPAGISTHQGTVAAV